MLVCVLFVGFSVLIHLWGYVGDCSLCYGIYPLLSGDGFVWYDGFLYMLV